MTQHSFAGFEDLLKKKTKNKKKNPKKHPGRSDTYFHSELSCSNATLSTTAFSL